MKSRHGLDEQMIVSAGTLPDLDEAFSRRIYGFETVTDLYRWSSCAFYLENLKTPMIFINARDDPIVPEPLLPFIRDFASSHDKVMYLELAHGGHLGFYEGGFLYANPVTWLDRALVGLVGGLVMSHNKLSPKSEACSLSEEDEPDLIKTSAFIYTDPLEKKNILI
ncbi:Abhydrolase domain-containing protein 2 [Eumeta japonica]|uniref:Abhydrolase domain-containing protein 2 n=1 Tax=Eumeta variegata TaxID=151549 RepID=A0A4C1VE01_EUMVA|nr:Abhydrolase domain-containing protein 2 [Eumeta japonica]